MLLHGIAQALPGEELHLGVDGQRHVAAVDGVRRLAHVFHHTAEAVADHGALAGGAGELLVVDELDAAQAGAIGVDKADHRRGRFTFGVAALVLADLLHALQVHRLDLGPDRLFQRAAQHDGAVVVQLAGQVGGAHGQQLGQLLAFGHVSREELGVHLHRGQGHATGQRQAVAVQHAAAAGGQLLVVDESLLALRLVEAGVEDLQVHSAAQQQQEGRGHQEHDKARSPRRRGAGQQRAGGVVDALHCVAHGRTPAGADAGTSST